MNPSDWQTLPDSQCLLGESPFWHPQERSLYWLDIPGRAVLRTRGELASPRVERWALPTEPGCMAPARSGQGSGSSMAQPPIDWRSVRRTGHCGSDSSSWARTKSPTIVLPDANLQLLAVTTGAAVPEPATSAAVVGVVALTALGLARTMRRRTV